MKAKRLLAAVLGGFLAVASVVMPVTLAAAKKIPERTLFFYGENGIYYYNNNGQDCAPATVGGENYNYAGATVWSDVELAAIEENQAIYQEAAEQYDIPWQVLAVIHSMESGLARTNPGNGQGLYQLYSLTNGGTNENRFAPGLVSEEEFRAQTMLAAQVISGMMADDSENVQKLFFKYNGASQKYIEKALAMGYSREEAESGAGSPYVMNRADSGRDPTSGMMESLWAGRYTADGQYTDGSTSSAFGAFVKYGALTGSGGFCSALGQLIADTALLLSWDGHGHDKADPKPEYVAAMKDVGGYIQPCNGTGCAPIGASCDQFVGTVMRYSGADADFPILAPGAQEAHMASRPDMYERVEASDVSELQPGDIFVTTENGRHIYIYTGDGVQASASFNDRTGEHFEGVYFSDGGTGAGTRNYTVYRRIG